MYNSNNPHNNDYDANSSLQTISLDHDRYSIPDNPSVLVAALSFFFPIIGIVLYFAWKDFKPRSAKSAIKWSLIGMILGTLFSIFLFIL